MICNYTKYMTKKNTVINKYQQIADELLKLHTEGLGVFVQKMTMEKDKVLHPRKCFSAFVKNDITRIDKNIFKRVQDIDCDGELYEANYNKTMDINMKKVAFQYHPHKENL